MPKSSKQSTVLVLCPLFRLILSTAKSTGLWCTCLKVPNKVLVLCPLFIIQVDFEHRQEHWPVAYMPICSSIKHCPCVVSTVQVDFEHRQEHWPVVYMPICSSIQHCLCVVSTVQVDFEHRQEHWPVVYMPICSSKKALSLCCVHCSG